MADIVEGVPTAPAVPSSSAAPSTSTPGGPSFEGENKFQHAIAAWRKLDFTTLTSNLDNTASEIVAYQRDSTVQRKDLAQKTKDFRKLDDPTKLTEIKGLLKAYQNFIDLLTNHSKSVNSAFLSAYTSLSNAPDPYPLLEASVDSMLVSEETLPKVTKENEHLQGNVAKLTTQLEETEIRLQTESTARKELEDNLETWVKEVKSSWSAVLEEKKDNWEAKEKSLEEKVENQDRLLNELRASYEVNQRLGKGSGEDQDAQRGRVSTAELEILNSDLERTAARLAQVEARNEQMRLELAQAKSSNSSLIRKLDAARIEREGQKRDLDTRLRAMERETALLKEERETLEAKVQKWSDYEDVKQELEVLKSIEFSTGDDDDKMLLTRNKKLGDELTILRVSRLDLQTRLEDLQEELSRTNAELERSQNLNEKLESDLENLQAEGTNAFPSGASVAGTYVTRAARRKGRISPTSSIISGMDPRSAPEREPMGGGSGILPMVTAQRDRFKKKNAELEQDLSDQYRTVQQLRQETYNRGGGATLSSTSAYSANPNPSTVTIGGTGNPGIEMDRYRQAYESNLFPFAAFRGRESAPAYRRMSLPERMVYSVTRMVQASRTSRNLFAVYCVALHVLVFFSLYWLGSADFEKHASN
ncbi:CASP C terminal-domain-containing protein [Ilyonectria robusta]|uniref:CASP C terminal-domain-containing protein n=1 Tax=Ilyonectria robusta TaxID=1079257 RepID=UPI001E8D6B34|nr:CASP C terminal-domain-containing protein [Ilyonectria robusta]KAH8656405.1 CASP C terminal-domain-containing protein [Ilyonectria robusta]